MSWGTALPYTPGFGSLPPLGGQQPHGALSTQSPPSSPVWQGLGQQRDSTAQLSTSQSLAAPNRPAQGLPGHAAAPVPPDEPALSPPSREFWSRAG